MPLPKASFTLHQSMAAMAILAASLALLRVNVALGALVGCVAGVTLMRTVRVLQSCQLAGAVGSAGCWLHAGLDSLIASTIIIGSADLAFLVVYFVAKHLAAPRMSDGPGPYVDWDAVYLAIPSGLAVGFIMRRLVWNRRFLPGDSANLALQGPRFAGPLNLVVRWRVWPMLGHDGAPRSRAGAVAFGGLVGAGLMGGIGFTHGSDLAVGAAAGAALVGALSYGVATGTMSPVTLSAVLFALFVCMIGPGCDDYGGTAAIPAAVIGAYIGRVFFGRRRRDA